VHAVARSAERAAPTALAADRRFGATARVAGREARAAERPVGRAAQPARLSSERDAAADHGDRPGNARATVPAAHVRSTVVAAGGIPGARSLICGKQQHRVQGRRWTVDQSAGCMQRTASQ
jgi:hypothetical protein